MIWLDGSNYSGMLPAVTVSAWKASGVEGYIAGTQDRNICRQQLGTVFAGGLRGEAYQEMYWTVDPITQIEQGVETVGDFPIEHLWIAVENPGAFLSVAALHDVVAACADILPGIYTRQNFWESNVNSSEFSYLDLWTAEYFTDKHQPSVTEFVSYGGWKAPLMWQFLNTHMDNGFSVDSSIRYDEAPPPPAPDPNILLALAMNESRVIKALADRYVWVVDANDPNLLHAKDVRNGPPGVDTAFELEVG